MKIKNLQRITISEDQKHLLEELSGSKILLRNTSKINQTEIQNLLEQSKQNALIYLERNKLGQSLSIFEENNLYVAVTEIQSKLKLKKTPRRIECYDISHLSGKFVYGSLVSFIDGKPAKKFYKLFKCKDQNNDFENHKEVLTRRFNRILNLLLEEKPSEKNLKSWALPDLIIVDGGKGQLSSDLQVIEEFRAKFKENNLSFDVEICALAKRIEEIFLPHNPISVILEDKPKFLVQRIRDEAHRFGITNNRNARLKTASKSELDDIKGIGDKTKQKILNYFGSVKNFADNLFTNQEMIIELIGKNNTEKAQKHYGI